MAAMNAADQARSPELAQAIASAVCLFRTAFPDARVNLTPWRDDPQTRRFDERDNLDFSLHFPGWSPRIEGRSLLVQLRLERSPQGAPPGRPRLLGVLIRGLTYDAERWRLTTLGDWQPSGSHRPHPEIVERLQALCRQLFELFGTAQAAGGSHDQAGDRAA
jgi:hypothetical protein